MGSQNKAKRKELEKAFKRQRGKCHLCGEPMNLSKNLTNALRATADHLIPKSMGGWVQRNIAAAHFKCNVDRRNMTVTEYKEWIKR